MRNLNLCMSMSLDGMAGNDREHPGMAIPERAELVGATPFPGGILVHIYRPKHT